MDVKILGKVSFPAVPITLLLYYSHKFLLLLQDECEALGMGGYLGVQQGSKFPPRFVHLTYRPENPFPNVLKIALIGKGLTFDR